jgi:preprotein translocase subunit SecA
VVLDLRRFEPELDAINARGPALAGLTDGQLRQRAREARAAAAAGQPLAGLRADFYALARELSHRRLGLRPFDEQIVAGLAMDRGAIVEMQTGEGKTLAAVTPAALQALAGRGVHVLTFNDYLARRDAEWMAPLYDALGLSIGFVHQGMPRADRQAAYRADVTYVTAKEAGFDSLRDCLVRHVRELVHRPFHMALVDEADSILIDEARAPLVVAGAVSRGQPLSRRIAELIATLTRGLHFDSDEYGRDVELTEAGIDHIERTLGCGTLHDEANLALLTDVNCALHAHVLLRRDVDYLVRDGRIAVIDEHTGRVVADRHWPDGLQAALEAKEGLAAQPDGRILGSITLQHFLRRYPMLCGMTGTARAAAAELDETYGRHVVVIPTHETMIRADRDDVIYRTRAAKERAVIREVASAHATGRPVLVGTLTVEESERLATGLRDAGVAGAVLNARNDAAEARIVAAAGAMGAVTISTNMAGRGTDIRLGEHVATVPSPALDHPASVAPASVPPASVAPASVAPASVAPASVAPASVAPGSSDPGEAVAALGGLYVIGTNRHESRRVDQQLRGRAGRQGDPGESRFLISLEDDLLVKYGIQSLLEGRVDLPEDDQPIVDRVVTAEVARAQRIVEGQNLEIRRTLARYASVLEDHRVAVMERRQAVLDGTDVPDIWRTVPDRVRPLIDAAGEAAVREAERIVTLASIDRAWCDHLALAADLREGIHLVSLGGLDPLTRYTTELNRHFQRLDAAIDEGVLAELDDIRLDGGTIVLPDATLKGPSSTWTYLVNDDPFRHQIGMMLTGPGKSTFAIGAALMSMPLLIFWGIVDRLFKRRTARR